MTSPLVDGVMNTTEEQCQIVELHCQYRSPREISKTGTKQLRRNGFVPCVLYRKAEQNLHFSVHATVMEKILHRKECEIYYICFEDGTKIFATIYCCNLHPVNDQIIHADFNVCYKDAHSKIMMPINFVNKNICAGIKLGGHLNIAIPRITIVCENMYDIPRTASINLTKYPRGSTILISHLMLSKSVNVVSHKENDTLATIV